MFEIKIEKIINAPINSVWATIENTDEYQEWNSFIPACNTTFEVGSPIIMKVNMIPRFPFTQKETIQNISKPTFLEYGIDLPINLLKSTRQHMLYKVSEDQTKYESKFILRGLLSSFVKLTLHKRLLTGFNNMTSELKQRSENIHLQRSNT